MDGYHPLIPVGVDDVEGDTGVLHPEGEHLRMIEDKEHSAVLGQGRTVHEPPHPLSRGIGDLDFYGGLFLAALAKEDKTSLPRKYSVATSG